VAFGRNLTRLRKRTDLSQEDLGLRAALHRTAVGTIERGERVARTDTLLKLAGSLDVGVEEFFKGMSYEPRILSAGGIRTADDDEHTEP
jgi:transcriptional regulator with XRE-family HTH domain